MDIKVIQHVAFEGPGAIADWAHARGHGLSSLYAEDIDPRTARDDFSLLVVMGGPMGVRDVERFPWLLQEAQFIEGVLARKTPILGICLGAQLLAKILGARIYSNRESEIGWFDVIYDRAQAQGTAFEGIAQGTDRQTVFHWHGETFDLPAGSRRLARSEACENQAFVYADSVYGLQYHWEVQPDGIGRLLENCAEDLSAGGPYVQSAETIAGQTHHQPGCEQSLHEFLDALTRR
jgi:GMP synthase-like glutamine amidotransferase